MTVPASSGELHAGLLTALGTGIVSGRYVPGQVLTLDAVSSAHAVSRSVAREAVRVLESMGMIAARRRIGITIQPLLNWNVFDPRIIRWRLDAGDGTAQLTSLNELRRGIEPVAAALAARRASPGQCRVMAAAVSDMVMHARSGDVDSYRAADKTFHQVLLDATGNEMFQALNQVLSQVLANCTPHGAVLMELHDDAARAVRVGDEAAAERAVRAILESGEQT